MMRSTEFSSKDFAAVPSILVADKEVKLIDRDVIAGGGVVADERFSNERKHLVRLVDLPSRVISMTIGGLEPGQSTRLHRHNYETIIYVIQGEGKSVIGDQEILWRAGDAYFVPVWSWHQHINTASSEKALYIACENAPLLQNLGVALREEA